MREVTIPITFKIGTGTEIGMGGFKQEWVSSESDDGTTYELYSGAGLGNGFMEATVACGETHVYAQAAISEVATELWNQMRTDLTAPPAPSAPGNIPGGPGPRPTPPQKPGGR